MTQGNVNLKLGLDTSPATAALQQYYKKLNQSSSQAAASQGKITTALDKVVTSAKKLGLTYDKVNKSFKDSKGNVQTLQQVKQRVDQLNASLAQTKRAADTALSGIGAGFKQVLQGIPQGIGLAIGQQLLAPLTNFGSALNGAVGGAVQRFVDIDAALRQTASISGATTAEFEELQTAVIGLAKDTKFTTGELAEASIALARAGFSAAEVQEALPGIAEGAAAAGQSMDQMSDTVIGAMGGFQKSTDETIDVVDILTQTANMSNQSVTDLGEALKYVGPIANGLGLTMEDTSAAIGLLANAGIRGSQAGTTLRSGLSRLAAAAAGNNSEFSDLSRGTGRLAETLKRLGADVTDTSGNLKAFPELLKTLKASLGDLGANEQQLVSKILFGEEAAAGFRALLANTVEDIDGFAEATNNATGVAKDTSKKNLAGIAGSLVLLSSAFDAASATVGQFLGVILKPLIDGATLLLNAFNSIPAPLQTVVLGFTGLTVAVTAATVAIALFTAASNAGVFATIGNAVSGAVGSFGTLAAAIKTQAVAAFGAAKASSLAFSAVMAKQITITGALTAEKAKLTAAQTALNAATGAGVGTTGLATTAAAQYATVQTSVGAAGTTSAAGSTAAAGGMKAFIAAAAPLAAVAAAVLAVAAAWDTYATVLGGVKEVQDIALKGLGDLDKTIKDVGASLDEQNKKTEDSNARWEAAVARVGGFQAGLDILRAGLQATTAEEARLSQETVALYTKFEESERRTDALTAKYEEIAQAMADGSSTQTRAKDMEDLKAIEETVLKVTNDQIKALEAHKQKHIETSGGIDKMTEAEKQVLQAIEEKLKGLGLSKDLLKALKDEYLGAADAAGKFGEAVKDAVPSLDEAKEAFQNQIKNMETSFKNFQKGFADGLKDGVSKIKDDLSDLKDEAEVFTDIKQKEIDSIKEVGKANEDAMSDRIEARREAGEAEVDSMQAVVDEADRAHDAQMSNLEDLAAKEQDAFQKRIDQANEAADAAIAALEEQQQAADDLLESEIAAKEQALKASNERYDAMIKGAREATERAVKNLEKQGEAEDAMFDRRIKKLESMNEAEKLIFDEKIDRISQETEAVLASLQKQQDAADAQLEKELRGLERRKDRSNDFYDNKIAAADRAHERTMANYDQELRALDAQRDAVNEAFDARLEGLKALTPAEQMLKQLRIQELEATAAMGGQDGLRAQATLERMRLDEEAARVRKEQAVVLAALEEQREAKEAQARAIATAHEATMTKLKSDRLQKEEATVQRIEAIKAKAREEEEARALRAEEIQAAAAARIEALEAAASARQQERLREIELIKVQQDEREQLRARQIQRVKENGEKKLKDLANDRERNEKRIQGEIEQLRIDHDANAKIREGEMKILKEKNMGDIDRLEKQMDRNKTTRLNDMDTLRNTHAENQKIREDDILRKQKENANEEKRLLGDLERLKNDNLRDAKIREDEIKRKKDEVKTAEKVALNDIKILEEAEQVRKNTAEDEFAQKKKDLLDDYEIALGETNDTIIREGDTTWTTYADNALKQIDRIKRAAASAASASTTTTTTSVSTNSSGFASRFTGGPVSAGQTYTVNELGQEAFKSSTGKLSLIDAPAFGRWKAPSKGTVINAAQTEKMGLIASTESPVSKGAAIDPTGGRASQNVSGNESRNLLRAIAKATGGDSITNNVTIQSENTTQAASDMMVELTKIKRRRLR